MVAEVRWKLGMTCFCSLWGETHIFGGEGWWDLIYIEIPWGTVCPKNIHMCRFHLHPLFKENEIEIAFEICNANGNKLVNQQLCFKSQIILVNGRIDLMFMNDKHRRILYISNWTWHAMNRRQDGKTKIPDIFSRIFALCASHIEYVSHLRQNIVSGRKKLAARLPKL